MVPTCMKISLLLENLKQARLLAMNRGSMATVPIEHLTRIHDRVNRDEKGFP
jgi:hypothetical protein